MSGGSAMPEELMKKFEEAFDCKILEGYGLSETSPVASFNHPDKERKPGSIGTPIEGVEMKCVDDDGNEVDQGEVGEILIKGHNIMKGYWNREDATKEAIKDGWFASGDMGKVDEDGYFFIVDRKKELIIRGGYNVYPREVEEVLYEHPAVQEAAVIGVEDEKMGEEVGAAVVLKKGEEVSEDELRDFVKNEVANYKYPRKIWFEDELPKGPTGKILKKDIEVPQEVGRRQRLGDRPRPRGRATISRPSTVSEQSAKAERAAHAVHARARLDPVARLGRLQEVDGQADGGAVLVVVGVGLDRAAEGEVREGREQAALHGAAVVGVALLGAQPEHQLVAAFTDVHRPDVLEEGALLGEWLEAVRDHRRILSAAPHTSRTRAGGEWAHVNRPHHLLRRDVLRRRLRLLHRQGQRHRRAPLQASAWRRPRSHRPRQRLRP